MARKSSVKSIEHNRGDSMKSLETLQSTPGKFVNSTPHRRERDRRESKDGLDVLFEIDDSISERDESDLDEDDDDLLYP